MGSNLSIATGETRGLEIENKISTTLKGVEHFSSLGVLPK